MLCKCGNPIKNIPAHLLDCGIGLICHSCAAGSERVHGPKPHLCDTCGYASYGRNGKECAEAKKIADSIMDRVGEAIADVS
jgi:hypothetical protein